MFRNQNNKDERANLWIAAFRFVNRNQEAYGGVIQGNSQISVTD